MECDPMYFKRKLITTLKALPTILMQTVNDEYCYTDRDEFQEDLENLYSDFDGSDKEFEQFIENIMVEYEPYWKKCIILYVDN